MYKVKRVNEFFVKEMLENNKTINCDAFYKDDLISIIEIMQSEYTELKEKYKELNQDIEDNYIHRPASDYHCMSQSDFI